MGAGAAVRRLAGARGRGAPLRRPVAPPSFEGRADRAGGRSFRRAPLSAAGFARARLRPNALAARPAATDGGCTFENLASEHFVVHYTADVECEDEVLYEPQAGDVLAAAEQTYKAVVTDGGFPAPVADADGKTDLYVYHLEDVDGNELAAIFGTDAPGAPQIGWIALNPEDAIKPEVAGSAFFHVVALNYSDVFQDWFLFGTAEWAGLRAAGWPTYESSLTIPEITLDCYGYVCDKDLFHYNGQARWPFYVYLQDRFGANAVRDLWQALDARNPTGVDGLGALTDYLASKSANLEDVFNDYAGAVAAGALSAGSLKSKPPTTVATIQTGEAVATLAPVKVGVNHLAARFVALTPGSGSNGNVCHPATLTVTVDIPAGVDSRPKFFYQGSLASFSVSGSKATLTAAWDTCTWKDERTAYVSLPNPETNANGKDFKVTAAITAIDMKTILSPNAPAPVADPRPSVATQGASPPPTLTIYGASPLQVGANRVLALHFFASNAGSVRLSLDGRDLGTLVVRAGQNLFRLRLPELKQTTRTGAVRTKASATLSLTSVSPTGQTGGTMERKVAFAQPKAKAKAKPAAKRPAAPGKPKPRR